MPSRPWPLWLLTGLLLAGFPAVNFIYWPQVLRSGFLPSNGDSISIPIFESVLLALVASPLLFGIAWLCLRRFNPYARLTAWRQDRPYRSAVVSLTFGAGAALVIAAAFDSLNAAAHWFEFLWAGYFLLWVPWFLALRAAIIEQLEVEPTGARS